ncbi:prolipoprotein diacylglyceryl transferase [Jatrophihabitans sp. DSM 45814]
MQRLEAAIPSPTVSVIRLGPLPIHIYALCIVAGILLAIWLTNRRWRARGGGEHDVGDVAGWAVIFGILGGRIYHVITDPELYFEKGRHPLDAFKIWDGGLGIWGAIALGGVGAYIGCRRHNLSFVAFADAAAPGVIFAQALGRLGNWFNNELYGRATTLPWRLAIHDMDVANGRPQPCTFGDIGKSICGYYQPTFLYELIWNVVVGVLLLWADRRFRLARGQVFALYVMGYTAGRYVIESLRSDHANHILGMRVNNWVAILVFLGGLVIFIRQRGKERSTARKGPPAAAGGGALAAETSPATKSSLAAESDLGGPDSNLPAAPDLASEHAVDPESGKPSGEPAPVGEAGNDASGSASPDR